MQYTFYTFVCICSLSPLLNVSSPTAVFHWSPCQMGFLGLFLKKLCRFSQAQICDNTVNSFSPLEAEIKFCWCSGLYFFCLLCRFSLISVDESVNDSLNSYRCLSALSLYKKCNFFSFKNTFSYLFVSVMYIIIQKLQKPAGFQFGPELSYRKIKRKILLMHS